jgi:hypothetical protein
MTSFAAPSESRFTQSRVASARKKWARYILFFLLFRNVLNSRQNLQPFAENLFLTTNADLCSWDQPAVSPSVTGE